MRLSQWIGVILIVLGVVGLLRGGVNYTKDKKAVDLGPVEVNVEDRERLRIPPALAATSLLGGVALVAVGLRRRR